MTRKPRRPNIRSLQPVQLPPIPNIIAIDPGHTTGVASYSCQPRIGTISLAQFRGTDHQTIVSLLDWLEEGDPDTIVYEQYVARPSRHGLVGAEAQKALSPVFVHGIVLGGLLMIRYSLQMPTFVPQQASEMASFPDKRLKAMFPHLFALTLGPAKPHARDALRHLLVYLKRHHFAHYQALKTPNKPAN